MKRTSSISIGLDIGSNTISCTKLQLLKNGHIEVIKDKSFPVRLSEGLKQGGELHPDAVARGLDALKKISSDFDYCDSFAHAVGTAVLRMTRNPHAFTEPAEKILGSPIEIIDGIEEARLTAIGAVFGLPHRNDWVILDIGGQSTELSCREDNGKWDSVSMPLGVVKVTENFFSSQTPPIEEQHAARGFVQQLLSQHVPPQKNATTIDGTMVCVGGTPTTLSLLVHGLKGWKRDKVHGDVITLDELQHWYKKVVAVDARSRIEKYGMKPMRADVFPAGILILDEMMQYLNMDKITVSANGLRVGLALSHL